MWLITFSKNQPMQNIPPLELVFNKGKDKNIAGLP